MSGTLLEGFELLAAEMIELGMDTGDCRADVAFRLARHRHDRRTRAVVIGRAVGLYQRAELLGIGFEAHETEQGDGEHEPGRNPRPGWHGQVLPKGVLPKGVLPKGCLLYTSDAADDLTRVDL